MKVLVDHLDAVDREDTSVWKRLVELTDRLERPVDRRDPDNPVSDTFAKQV